MPSTLNSYNFGIVALLSAYYWTPAALMSERHIAHLHVLNGHLAALRHNQMAGSEALRTTPQDVRSRIAPWLYLTDVGAVMLRLGMVQGVRLDCFVPMIRSDLHLNTHIKGAGGRAATTTQQVSRCHPAHCSSKHLVHLYSNPPR